VRQRIGRTDEVPEGQMRQFLFSEEEVLVFNLRGRFYGLAGRCTHAGAPLVDGTIEGNTLTCPWHGSRFDIVSGNVLGGPAREPLKQYRVSIEDDYIVVTDYL
jgi:nitrite reductase/ring-hydroxylating ferredoxin subunit